MSIVTIVMEISLLYRFLISWEWESMSVSVSGANHPPPWNLSSAAGEDVSASSNHVFGESKLLAVENKCISILPEACIADSALFLQTLQSVPLVIDLTVVFFDAPIIIFNAIIVLVNCVVVTFNAVFKVVNLVVQFDHRLSESFKRNHQLCFGLDSFFVFNLVPDWVPLVEVADLIPEVTCWNITVGLRCIVLDFISRILANRLMIDGFWRMVDWFWCMVDWFWRMVDWHWFMIVVAVATRSMVMSISVIVSLVNVVVRGHIRILTLIEDFTFVNWCGFSIVSIEKIVISS